MTDIPALSIVVPIFNEEGNLSPLFREIEDAFQSVCTIEIIAVDDCSDDGSALEVETALSSGHVLAAARGRWIATIDGDGQNVPADLAQIWPEIESGPERLFAGVRQRRNDGIVKWFTSRFANFVRKRLLRDNCRDTACGLKVLPASFAHTLPYFDNLHRFFPALASRAGLEVVEFSVDDRPREHGVSKYGFFDRAAVAFLDTVGVYWLARRHSDPGEIVINRPA